MSEDELADYLIENAPSFKIKSEEAYAKYQSQGGATADALIKKLEKCPGKKRKCKVVFSPSSRRDLKRFQSEDILQLLMDIKNYLEVSTFCSVNQGPRRWAVFARHRIG